MSFDTIITVDWSGGNDRGPTPTADAIWTCIARKNSVDAPIYHRNRQVVERWLITALAAEVSAGRRVLAVFDLCFAYPVGFAKALTDYTDPLLLWDWFAERVRDEPSGNNRFDLAADINNLFDGVGPFWGNGLKRDIAHLPRKGRDRTFTGIAEKRATDLAAKGAFSPWQLSGAGAVGSQVIMGMPVLSRLRHHFGADLAVWPFEAPDKLITLAESYFSLLPKSLAGRTSSGIKDADQVKHFARTFAALNAAQWAQLLDVPSSEEGWVLGAGHEDMLERVLHAPLVPPPLKNDCFAMPQGAVWTPVDDALEHLQRHLECVCETQEIPLHDGAQRILATSVRARRAHPPQANAAVDGYGFAGGKPSGLHRMPLVDGRAAAGVPYDGCVPEGHAIRILTGATLPAGVDTVILQEDVTTDGATIAFHGPLKKGVNARKAGEDLHEGDIILPAGRRLTPADLAVAAATGTGQVLVRQPLRVGVLSTGDELIAAGEPATPNQIYDANRPMLCATLKAWGHYVVDLGRAPDDRDALRGILNDAAQLCDAVITSGGASAGEEDHMSALLQDTGSFALWRIAIKPGRPLALGLWGDTPVFGLPGNPVAAQVCALVFVQPALSVLAGAGWTTPQAFQVPAGFVKTKKAGRREYLRARITNGRAEIFPSEGSGRVSGLSWATGLVVMPDAAITIHHGEPVSFIPFSCFGL